MKKNEVKKDLPTTTQKYMRVLAQNKSGIVVGISFSIIFALILFVSLPIAIRYMRFSKDLVSPIVAQAFTLVMFIFFILSLVLLKNSYKKYKEDKTNELKRQKKKKENSYLYDKISND